MRTPQGGSGGMTYSWQIGGQEVGTEEYLYWYTGTAGFQITLLGWAGDGQVDTATVTVGVTPKAPGCVLKAGQRPESADAMLFGTTR